MTPRQKRMVTVVAIVAGVGIATAFALKAFNQNLLVRANRELGATFDLAAWEHTAFYQPALQRIEMHLVSRCRQAVRVAGEPFAFDEGESIHTENSYKYTVDGFQALARRAGWAPKAVWTDGRRQFSLHWLEPAAPEEAR